MYYFHEIFCHNKELKKKHSILGLFRDTCQISDNAIIIYILFHFLFFISLTFHFFLVFYSNFKAQYSEENFVFFLRCISIYFHILHRILRPANRVDVLRTFLEIEIPEICMDYYDCCELLAIYLETQYATIKFIDFLICGIWIFSIILRFFYLSFVHFSYKFAKRIWIHLGHFQSSKPEISLYTML